MAHQTANRLRGGKNWGKTETGRETVRQTGRQADRQTSRQTGRQAGRQADIQTDTYGTCTFFGVCLLYIVSCHNYMYYVCET